MLVYRLWDGMDSIGGGLGCCMKGRWKLFRPLQHDSVDAIKTVDAYRNQYRPTTHEHTRQDDDFHSSSSVIFPLTRTKDRISLSLQLLHFLAKFVYVLFRLTLPSFVSSGKTTNLRR